MAANDAPRDDHDNNSSGFRRIVVPLDGSPVAERALPYAEDLARLLGVPLHFVRVTDPLHPGSPLANLLAIDALTLEVWLEGERAAARDYLAQQQGALQARGLHITVEHLEGPPADAVLAATQPGDLLVMATHGRGGPARWFMGSTAESIVRRSPVPVFVIRADASAPSAPALRRIVVPVDGSATAEQALPIARDLATRLQIPVHLVTVIDVPGGAALNIAVAAVTAERLEETLIALLTEAERDLAHACDELGGTGLEVTTDVLHGEPGRAITNAAQPGDLIVMTTHGRSGTSRLLLGSVAEAAVRRSMVPVLLMRVAPGNSPT
jgi:nucleotide-binding universal stress UspA family protein